MKAFHGIAYLAVATTLVFAMTKLLGMTNWRWYWYVSPIIFYGIVLILAILFFLRWPKDINTDN